MQGGFFSFLGSREVTVALWKFSAIGFGILAVVFIVIRILLAIKRRQSM